MNIVGITGPSGSGKSLLGNYISSLGLPTIDADEVYHSLLVPPSECLDRLRSVFGNEIFFADGNLDRGALSKIVFNDKEKLSLLNSTVLEIVLDKIRSMIKEFELNGYSSVFVDAPTLIESGFHKECNTVISVIAPMEKRIERIIARDNIPREKAEERIKAQKCDDFYRAHSDFVLVNDNDTEDFLTQIKLLLKGMNI